MLDRWNLDMFFVLYLARIVFRIAQQLITVDILCGSLITHKATLITSY